jgi:hypothetical protein
VDEQLSKWEEKKMKAQGSKLRRVKLENCMESWDLPRRPTFTIEGYVDNLWARIGGKLSAHGVGPQDVASAIRDVRNNH